MGKPKTLYNMVANGVTATGIAWGPNKGHVVEPLPKRVRPSTKQGLGVKVKLARDVIREVCGYTPYERRAMELLSQGFDKRALKFCKKRVSFLCLACDRWLVAQKYWTHCLVCFQPALINSPH